MLPDLQCISLAKKEGILQPAAGQDTSHVTTAHISDSFCSWPSQECAEGCPSLHQDRTMEGIPGSGCLQIPLVRGSGAVGFLPNLCVHHQSQGLLLWLVAHAKAIEAGHISAVGWYRDGDGGGHTLLFYGYLRVQHKSMSEHRFAGTHCTTGLTCSHLHWV